MQANFQLHSSFPRAGKSNFVEMMRSGGLVKEKKDQRTLLKAMAHTLRYTSPCSNQI